MSVAAVETGALSGSVTAEDGTPIANVTVELQTWEDSISTVTDAQGAYIFANVAAKSYVVMFDPPEGSGLLVEYYDNASSFWDATWVPVAAGQTTPNINAALSLGGIISGQVTDLAGQPLADARVEANSGYVLTYVTTDAEGRYQIRQLPTQSYKVTFEPPVGSGLMSEYFDNVTDPADATLVPVAVGQVTPDINAALAPGGTISGRVTRPDGQPVPDLWVEASGASLSQFVATDADGRYRVPGLPTGDYRIHFHPAPSTGLFAEYYDNSPDAAHATLVPLVVGETVENIDAVLAEGSLISGTVTDNSGTPAAGVTVGAYSTTGASGASAMAQVTTTGDGSYDLLVYPGTYVVSFTPPPRGNLVGEFYDNSPDYAGASRITTMAGQPVTGVDATLASAGRISGTVVADDGTPVPRVTVTAIPTAGGYLPPVLTNADGTYTLSAVPPGSYIVKFSPPVSRTPPPSPLLLQYFGGTASYEKATPVQVAGGQTTEGINATLITGASISGTVTAADGTPIRGVTVYPRSSAGGVAPWATTGANGTYRIDGIAAGDYTLVFDPTPGSGLLEEYYDNAPTPQLATPVKVVVGQNLAGIDAQLAIGGSIEGTITSSGAPVASVLVYAFSPATGYSMTVSTDADGHYRIPDLPSDSYIVRFVPMPDTNLGAEYYDNVTDPADATPVIVTAGAATGGIDADLTPAPPPGDVSMLIIGGSDAAISDAPWQVHLGVQPSCGGSLIAPSWVITAAHCIAGQPRADFIVFAGSATAGDGTSRMVPATEIYVHPGYDPDSVGFDKGMINDIALLKLAEPYELTPGAITPIDLPIDQDPAAWPQLGTQALITGWGRTQYDPAIRPTTLQRATVDILGPPSSFTCGLHGHKYDPVNNLCAGLPQGDVGTCKGDSGGPLAVNGVLAGITSWGRTGCVQLNYPDVFVRVANYLDWIIPAPAAHVAATPGDGQATVNVTPPGNSPALPTLGWLLFESVDGGAFQQVTDTLQTGTTLTRTGLTNGHTYQYAVRYYNDVNLGTPQAATAYSQIVMPVGPTPPVPPVPPTPPTPPAPGPAPEPAPPNPHSQPVAALTVSQAGTGTTHLAATGAAIPPRTIATLGLVLLLLGSIAVSITPSRSPSH